VLRRIWHLTSSRALRALDTGWQATRLVIRGKARLRRSTPSERPLDRPAIHAHALVAAQLVAGFRGSTVDGDATFDDPAIDLPSRAEA
jgi:hypothetical protein